MFISVISTYNKHLMTGLPLIENKNDLFLFFNFLFKSCIYKIGEPDTKKQRQKNYTLFYYCKIDFSIEHFYFE